MANQHTIELNGDLYDAATGKRLAVKSHPKPSAAHLNTNKAKSIDGFASQKSHSARKSHAFPVAHHPTKKSQTLMRRSVKKPVPSAAAVSKSAAPSLQKRTPQTVPAARMRRLQDIGQSQMIKRFTSDISHVKGVLKRPLKKPENLGSVSSPIPENNSQFDRAIDLAGAHNLPKVKKAKFTHRIAKRLKIKPRTFSVVSVLISGFLFASFIAWQNAPNIAMKIASERADIAGNLPSYQPAGFSFTGSISYQPGEIKVAYKANADNRSYSITQKASGWDSETLRQNYVADKTQSQTIQEKGKTIYLYDGNNATWVDGGIWYRIEGDSKLNSDQLLKLAASL